MHYQLGNTLQGQGKAEEAIVEYQQTIKLNSDYVIAHNAIGVTRSSQVR